MFRSRQSVLCVPHPKIHRVWPICGQSFIQSSRRATVLSISRSRSPFLIMSSLTSPTSVSTPSSTNRSISTTSTGSPAHSPAPTPTSASTTLNSQTHIGFIGGGQMASAMIQGLIRANTVRPSQVSASDAQPAQLQALRQHGITTTQNNVEIAKTSNVIILSVKPHIVSVVLREISSYITPHHILISIAAGVTLSTMEAQLPQGSRVIRVMPNTPALVGLTAACYSLGINATTQDAQLVEIIISAIGKGHPVDEKLLDAVTGLSGSGPAYVFIFIEALADGGVRAGLPRDVAMALAAQTVLGSAKMVLETGKHPAQLKDAVASPGGTTIAGIHALETGQFRGTVMNAVVAASQRATELAEAAKKQSNSKL